MPLMRPHVRLAAIGLSALLVLHAGRSAYAQSATPPAAARARRSHTAARVLAGAAGLAAGGAIGARGLSFADVPPADRRAHEWRAGLTYGAIGGVLAAAVATAFTAHDTPAHPFWWSRSTTPLWVGIAAVQGLDFTSTRDFRAHGKDEWLLTNRLVDRTPAFAATEVSAAAAAIAVSYLLHRTGHHRLERWVAASYVGVGVVSAVSNYRYATTGRSLIVR